MAFQVKGIRRVENGGRVEVLVEGGWMRYNLVAPKNQLSIQRDPQAKQFLDPVNDDGDPWSKKPFAQVWADPEEYDASEDQGSESNASEGTPQGGNPEGNAGDAKFQMPADGYDGTPDGPGSKGSADGKGADGSGGSGDDGYYVPVMLKDEDGNLLPQSLTYENFDHAYGPRAEQLGQAIMEQTVTFVRNDIAQAVAALTGDIGEALEASEANVLSQVDAKLKSFQRKESESGGGNGGGYVVKVELHTPKEVRDIEGLAHHRMPQLLRYVAAGEHVYLPGPPGTGKSHAAKQVADSLGYFFGSISLGPTTPESRLWGGMDAHGKFHEPGMIECLRYARDNPESGSVFCADEMDNGHPGIIATVNSLLANGWVTLPNGETLDVGRNFVLIAAANTYGTGPTAEFAGRNRLDAATLDRFVYLPWETDLGVESALVKAHLAETENGEEIAMDWLRVWRTTRKNVEDKGLKVFVTMRGAIKGAKLLAMGESLEETWAVVLGNKLPEDQRKKVNPL